MSLFVYNDKFLNHKGNFTYSNMILQIVNSEWRKANGESHLFAIRYLLFAEGEFF